MRNQLIAKHLAKQYKNRWVVKDFSISLHSGEVVGLLGPNGAGKTTSFYMMVGLVSCDQGSILLNNEEITYLAMDKRAQKGIGYLPQEPSVFRKLSVRDNIMAILELNPKLNKEHRENKLEQLLQEFHIHHISETLGMSLSGGERRRVEIARALASDPKFILLDEPFAGIDPISVIDIKQIILQLKNRGIGVLITDHNVRETLDICERAYIVNEGSILAEGEPKALLQNKTVKTVYLGEDFDL